MSVLRRVPEKGKPDFSNLDDKRVRKYRDVVNEMIGAFSEIPDVKKVLTEVWKELSNECAERTVSMPEVAEEKVTYRKPCRIKRSTKVPLKCPRT